MKVTTKHTSNANGRGQVIAKGMGKQLTISWDHSTTPERNNELAAVAFKDKHFPSGFVQWPCEVKDNGVRVWTLYI